MDTTDLLLKLAMFGCFVVFAVAMWFIRKERDKQKNAKGQEAPPRENSRE
jgi:hypothetical protein